MSFLWGIMLELIVSQLIGYSKWLLAGLGGLAVILLQRWRNKRLAETVERQGQVIRGHEAKEEINRQDKVIDGETDTQINDLRRKVDGAETPEHAAQEIASGLNDYFK